MIATKIASTLRATLGESNLMTPIAPPIDDEKAYIIWFAKYSPEFEGVRSWISGDINKFANTVADMCVKKLAEDNTAEKLFAKLVEINAVFQERLLPVINENGGLKKLLSMPPQLIQATIQMSAQLFVFNEILAKKYSKYGELLATMDTPNVSRT
jgi:hypothetical protein